MPEVTIKIDGKFFNYLLEQFPWLSYDSIEDFVFDAVRCRIESLLHICARTQFYPELQTPQIVADCHKN